MRSQVIACLLALFLSFDLFAQADDTAGPPADSSLNKEQAVAMLRETLSDVGNLRTLENRISFTSELAALMWYYDQREGRSLFGSAVGDFKALLVQYDQQMNALGAPAEGEDNTYSAMMFGEPTDRARLAAKFQMSLAVRQQLAMSIAEHEPELAYNFFHDSASSITNAQFRERLATSDAMYETRLLAAIAKTDASRAADLAMRSTSRKFTLHHVELLKQIHAKDPEQGVKYGADLLSRLKEHDLAELEIWSVTSLLSAGETFLKESKGENGKAPVYSQNELRDIAEVLARVVDAQEEDEYGAIGESITRIEAYHPGRAAQLRTKFKIKPSEGATYTVSGGGIYTGTSVEAPRPPGASAEPDPQVEMMETVAKLEKGELPAEERRRILGEARTIIGKSNSREKKILGLSMLAGAAKRAGDEEIAVEVMREAEALVTSNPKTYQDMIYVWMIISGYAEVRPDRSFALLEDTIFRVNGLIDAFVRIAEFIDVGEQMIVDGEFQVGSFGGGMIRQMTAMSGMADGTLRTLAKADVEKLRTAASRFDRPEIRVLAKMMVLRTILDKPVEDELDVVYTSDSESGLD